MRAEDVDHCATEPPHKFLQNVIDKGCSVLYYKLQPKWSDYWQESMVQNPDAKALEAVFTEQRYDLRQMVRHEWTASADLTLWHHDNVHVYILFH